MKIAITACSPDIAAQFDERFGRCPYFIVFDEESQQWEAKSNPALDELGGAGTLAAQFIANIPVEAVISGKFGPKAASVLNAASIRMLESGPGRVDEIIKKHQSGTLMNSISDPDKQSLSGQRNRRR
jgi:predicted Fe-Mo cluster-binding NifX family protein